MGRPSDKDRVKKWLGRTESADKAYKKWFDRFDVDTLERLYIGEHDEGDGAGKYKVNLCFASVETRLSMMTVDRPFMRVAAKAPRSDDMQSKSENRAKLREDTVNCFIADPDCGFLETTELGAKEAHWAFAVAEVVYSNDFIDNPNADKPLLNENNQDTGVMQPDKVPNPENDVHEYVTIKRIPPECFRVSMNPKQTLKQCDWVGYYEWHHVSDVKANKNYSNTSNLKATGNYQKDYIGPISSEDEMSREGMVRLWKIWDNRASKKLVFTDGGEKFLLEEDFDIFPFAGLRIHKIGKEWYPIPPMFNWREPQRGLNKTRQAQMVYLDRAYSKWLYADGAIDSEEMDKLATPKEGVYAKANGSRALSETVMALQGAPMDASFWRNIPASKEDFIQVSAVSSEQRGVSDANTATQASLVDINAKRRETKDTVKVAQWMAEIGWILLQTIEKNMALPFWIKSNVDPTGPNAQQEAADVIATWREITSEVLGDLNYEVSVDVESLSPLTEDTKRNQWMGVLGLLNNPVLVMALMSSDTLLKKTLGYFGIKSDRDIMDVKQAFQSVIQGMQQMQQQQQQQKQQGGAGGGPDLSGIMSQISSQMGTGGMPQ